MRKRAVSGATLSLAPRNYRVSDGNARIARVRSYSDPANGGRNFAPTQLANSMRFLSAFAVGMLRVLFSPLLRARRCPRKAKDFSGIPIQINPPLCSQSGKRGNCVC